MRSHQMRGNSGFAVAVTVKKKAHFVRKAGQDEIGGTASDG